MLGSLCFWHPSRRSPTIPPEEPTLQTPSSHRPVLFGGRRIANRLLWLVSACLLLLTACGPKPPRATRGYILISIDTLRADHLGAYGYGLPTSPFIDSLAAQGAVFEQAYVQLPGTLPSHMSIFTGLYPEEHGVFPPSGVLSPDIKTLPEILQQNGFRTGGHSEGGYAHGGYGFDRGFEDWSHEAAKRETDIEDTFARGVKFLEGVGPEEPFFLFLHTYAVHDPYFPTDEYLSQFWTEPKPDTFPATGPNLASFNAGHLEMDETAARFYKASYDASIRYMDDQLKALFGSLDEMGLLDDVTVILTSDHGEEFLEHGEMLHNQLYPETLRVPLIFLHPDVPAGLRVPSLVQSIDIAPTVYDLAGLEETPKASGFSLKSLIWPHTQPKDQERLVDRRAFALEGDRSARAILAQREDAESPMLKQMIWYSLNEGQWIEEEVALDAFESSLKLSLLSYHEPRVIEAVLAGEVIETFEVAPDKWLKAELSLPDNGQKKRVILRGKGCTVPAEVSDSADDRCLSFRLRGGGLRSLELYNLLTDPLAAQDISEKELSALRRLTRELADFEPLPVAAADSKDLPPELVERLRSLGYLP